MKKKGNIKSENWGILCVWVVGSCFTGSKWRGEFQNSLLKSGSHVSKS